MLRSNIKPTTNIERKTSFGTLKLLLLSPLTERQAKCILRLAHLPLWNHGFATDILGKNSFWLAHFLLFSAHRPRTCFAPMTLPTTMTFTLRMMDLLLKTAAWGHQNHPDLESQWRKNCWGNLYLHARSNIKFGKKVLYIRRWINMTFRVEKVLGFITSNYRQTWRRS